MDVLFNRICKPHEAASTDDSRPVLTGVYVDPKGVLVASDGFILVAIPCEIRGAPRDFAGCIVPVSVVKAATSQKGGPALPLTFSVDTGKRTASALDKNGSLVTGHLLSGSYPHWRTLVPEPRGLGKVDMTAFGASNLTRIGKALGADTLAFLSAKSVGSPTVVLPRSPDDAEGYALAMQRLLARDQVVAEGKRLLTATRKGRGLTAPKPRSKPAPYTGVVERTPVPSAA